MGGGQGEGCGPWRNEPGFTRVATIDDIRAKDGNLSIPLYVASESSALREDTVAYRVNGPSEALSAWLESSRNVR
jgi:type I restriction enzyme M protein